jgi:DNA replication and repair protein RecF
VFIERLYAEGFRNLDPLEWRPHRHFNLIAGDNGQGKTNLLEAVFVAAGLRSFRASKLSECVQFGAEKATLAVQYRRRGDRGDLGLQISAGRGTGRKITVDGKPGHNAADYLGKLVVVLFSAADLLLPHAEPADRRRWLDRVVFNHDAAHLHDLRQYERVLGSRNALLKEWRQRAVDPDMLGVYEAMLARHGAAIARRRLAVIDGFAPLVREVFTAIAAPGLTCDVVYEPKGLDLQDLEGSLVRGLAERRDRDRQLGYTTRGPHRDDVDLRIADRPAQLHASQGQSRALVLACKIAEIRSLEQTLGEPPVLLMDDVSSELDARRNAALMQYLDALGGQVVLTTTDPAFIQVAAPRQVLHVHAGVLHPGEVLGRRQPASSDLPQEEE